MTIKELKEYLDKQDFMEQPMYEDAYVDNWRIQDAFQKVLECLEGLEKRIEELS